MWCENEAVSLSQSLALRLSLTEKENRLTDGWTIFSFSILRIQPPVPLAIHINLPVLDFLHDNFANLLTSSTKEMMR